MNDQERFAALRERLSRQMRIKELGEDGEKRILKTRFLVIGAGGLGSPALLYLASSGASHIPLLILTKCPKTTFLVRFSMTAPLSV